MKKFLIALAAVFSLPAHAQIDEVLLQIEQNNGTLRALSNQAEADKLANRTGIAPSEPEVEFARLWGRPGEIGNRTDIAVTQSFDFATISGARARQARRRSAMIDMGFASERTAILLEAKQYCIELIHCNRLARELDVRLGHARSIADGYARKLESGDASRLEYNKALLGLSTVQGEIARNDVERAALTAELRRLNGGAEIALDAVVFPSAELPADFDGWLDQAADRSPVLEYVRAGVEADRGKVSLARTEWLPEFNVGYLREQVPGELFQGITVGVSIPLWSNANRVRQAQASLRASQARAEDARVQFCEQLRNLYSRAVGLHSAAVEYDRALSELSGAGLLEQALDAGAISLLEYIVETGLYYDTRERAMEAERDFQLAQAELSAVWL